MSLRGIALVFSTLACWLAAATSASAETGSDWPQSRRTASNEATLELTAPRSGPAHAWSLAASDRAWGYQPGITVWSSAAVALVDGRALLVAGSFNHNVHALDAASGERRWTFTTGGMVLEAPVIARVGERMIVFATATDRSVYALDASDGRQRWARTVEPYRPTIGEARLSAGCVTRVGGRAAVVVGYWTWDRSLGRSLQRGGLLAMDALTGEPLWRRVLGDNQLTAPVAAQVSGAGLLLVGSSDGALTALAAETGEVRWRQVELDAIRSPPAFAPLPGGPLVVMASKYGMVRGLDARDGRERWRYKTGDRITGAPLITTLGGRAVVVIGSYDRKLYALDAEGGLVLWRYAARGGVYSSPALAATPGGALLLASAWDHTLHVVSADGSAAFQVFTGRPLWNVTGIDQSNWASPVTARINGTWMAFLGGYDGVLRALPLEARDRAAPVARSDLAFWLSFPLVLAPVTALALALTWRHRRRRSQ